MMNTTNKSDSRKLYLDFLRIFAIFLVLFTHTGTMGSKLYTIAESPLLRILYLYLDCFRTINNPLLFMISGVLLLGGEESIGKIWRKRVLRFSLVLIIFTYIQGIFACVIQRDFSNFSPAEIFIKMLAQPVRPSYWYLYSYLSFLAMLPFLRAVSARMDRTMLIYLLVLTIVVQDLFPIISCFLGIEKVNFNFFLNTFYVLYPLIGFYLDKHFEDIRKNYKNLNAVLLCGSFCGLTAAVAFTLHMYEKTNTWTEKYIVLFYTISAIAVFCIMRQICEFLVSNHLISSAAKKRIKSFSEATFGIYLLENILERITAVSYRVFGVILPSLPACLLYLAVTMVLGWGVVSVLKKYSSLGKLI